MHHGGPLRDHQGLVGDTPMRRLSRLVGRDDVEIYAKLEGTNLGGSVKDRAALSMVAAAERAGLLDGTPIVEPTSGNTGIALAMVAALKRLPITLVMPQTATRERVAIMRAYGATVVLTEDMLTAIDHAKALHAAGTHHMLDQFSNPANPQVHFETTGPELLAQTDGRITHLVSAMGTTGTIMGVARFFAAAKPSVRIIGVHPEEGSQIPGIRAWPEAYMPAFYEPERVHRILKVSRDDAMATTRRLAKEEGLFVGISAGGAACAALRVAQDLPPNSVLCFIVPDRGDKYLSVPGLFG